jgi:hypothetical protein
MICVGNDNDVRDVISGKDGMINYLKKGSVIVDHTTTSSELSMEMNELLNPNDISILMLLYLGVRLELNQVNYPSWLEETKKHLI